MAKTAKKRMTRKEIELRAQCKKDLQARGVIPPDKPRLNRKKFAREVIAEYKEVMDGVDGLFYLQRVVWCAVHTNMVQITPEKVGVLKLLKTAVETKRYMDELAKKGEAQYDVKDYIEKVILPIDRL